MHVVHVCGNLTVGGIINNVSGLADSFTASGISSEVIGLGVPGEIRYPNLKVSSFSPAKISSKWGWSGALVRYIRRVIENEKDPIVHVEGIWLASHIMGARQALKHDVPFVLSPHGQLSPWILRAQGSLKQIEKTLYWKTLASRSLEKASACHAQTHLERDDICEYLRAPKVSTIPIGINFENYTTRISEPQSEGYLLFLGRLHPVKGVDILIRSFAKADISPKWKLVIAGPPMSDQYLSELKSIAASCFAADRIKFVGPILGERKKELVQGAWCQVVPSHTESIANVNLEAGGEQTPTITTHITGLRDWEEGGGLLVDPEVKELTKAIETSCRWTIGERIERGQMSQDLVRQNYNHETIIPKWRELYGSVLG